jgi:hypothetical protein
MLLQDEATGFTLWTNAKSDPPGALKPECALTVNDDRVEVSLTGVHGLDSADFPEALDFWEVDWMFDGQIFRSRSHNVRPLRNGDLALKLSYAYEKPGSYAICIRIADAEGRCGQELAAVQI